jgi:hypothetical protein
MSRSDQRANIEPGMKVSVRRSNQNRIGVVTRLEGDYVILRWINTELREVDEYYARRDDVMPLAGWL